MMEDLPRSQCSPSCYKDHRKLRLVQQSSQASLPTWNRAAPPRWHIFFRASDSYQWPKYLKRLKQQRFDALPSFLTLSALTGDKFALVHFEAPQVQDRLAKIARHDLLSPELSNLTPPKHTKMVQTPTLANHKLQIRPNFTHRAHLNIHQTKRKCFLSKLHPQRPLSESSLPSLATWPLKPDGLGGAVSSFCTARRYRRPMHNRRQ